MKLSANPQQISRTVRWYQRILAASVIMVLWVLAGLLGFLPDPLQAPPREGLIVAFVLFVLALLLEHQTRVRTKTGATRARAGSVSDLGTERTSISPIDRRILRALHRKELADQERAEEVTIFPQMMAKLPEECFVGAKPIEITFEDLGRLPTLVLAAIEESLDHVPPLPPEAISKRRRPDIYHVRANGPRYDIRTLRSVGVPSH